MTRFKSESAKITQVLSGITKVLILTHVGPDGDALGSCFGLAHLLKKKKKRPVIALEEGVKGRFRFLVENSEIPVITDPEQLNLRQFDAVFVLDTSSVKRLGAYSWIIDAANDPEAKKKFAVVNIDHHPDNTAFGTLNVLDSDAGSACQIVTELFSGQLKKNQQAAFALYTGIVSDSGSFRHGPDMRRIHEAAIILLKNKIDTCEIHDHLYAIETEKSLKLFARALQSLQIVKFGSAAVAYMLLSQNDYQELKADITHSEGFISRMQLLEGAGLVVFFNEVKLGVVKVSLRSNEDYNTGEFATKFGGGGHARAAGFIMEGTADKVVKNVISSLETVLKK